ncbi:MAG: cyclic 2,3-diphosphoglycerate synthase [Nitrospirota bacterium]|nr:cyclic 2,3-diphosphoglycerate synthase [Nitrospirota bacterium]MDH5586760.1 cyclic 2,3-diphosphoglycerate synthase [Nitrospirota bacterium]MDH5775292.1 cyclic 2,3-diphosphoglycerate synthase [Nitrospirota bacterium]
MKRIKILIMGAAGRDFHNFNVVFRHDPTYEVVAFTAAQIPNIEDRWYPPLLAGELYPQGIPIRPEDDLESLITNEDIAQVVFSYSDISHVDVMHKASRVTAWGADFRLLGCRSTMLPSTKPVISICAVRTGAGKSPVARKTANLLQAAGLQVAVVRHPMPYGDLAKQVVQRFATPEDISSANCTIEEREEYEQHIQHGNVVYAGVDYQQILEQAEGEADVIVWDGGNNDLPFFQPELEIVLVDPHRAGDEQAYFPGEVNLLRADVLVLTKLDSAPKENIAAVRTRIAVMNASAQVIDSNMPIRVEAPEKIRGARVLVVEDGPTLTHGGMSFGAGVMAAMQYGAAELIDPRPFAVGSISQVFTTFTHIGALLPAMGYGPQQIHELEETINRVDCDLVLIATPVDLARVVPIRQPTCRVTYEFQEIGRPNLQDVLREVLVKAKSHA